jgi:hypothetical protein
MGSSRFRFRRNPVSYDWSGTQVTPNVINFWRWIYGVLGATMAGWGAIMAFLARAPFSRKEKWA